MIRTDLALPRASLRHDLDVSARIDAALGLNVTQHEADLSIRRGKSGEAIHNFWVGLHPEALQTGYLELAQFVGLLRERFARAHWVDLGAAYGRLGIVLRALAPECTFLGIEAVAERVEAGRGAYVRLGLNSADLMMADLEAISLANLQPAPRVLFLYDFGPRESVLKLLSQIRELAAYGPLAVVARGRGSQNWIDREHPWLSQVNEPLRLEHATVYFS